jgi:hypothetical protein
METPAQRCERLLSALEDLASAEAASVGTRDFSAVLEVQDRAGPLVEFIATHGPAVADARLRSRITAFLRRRAETGERIARQISEVREELARTRASQHRVARIAPVYGSAPSPGFRQLSAVH